MIKFIKYVPLKTTANKFNGLYAPINKIPGRNIFSAVYSL